MFDKDEYKNPEVTKVVQIIDCSPGVTDTGEHIAIIRTSHSGNLEYPMMIYIPDVQKLLVHLLNVLAYHDEKIPLEVNDVLHGTEGDIARALAADFKPPVRPSKRATMPITPITSLEMARFWQKVGRTKNDADLLRLIGLSAQEIGKPRRNYPRRKRKQ